MEIFKTITEGGQIWAHRIRMAKQVLKTATITYLVVSFGCLILRFSQTPITLHHFEASYHFLHAKYICLPEDKVLVSRKLWWKLTHQGHTEEFVLLPAHTVERVCERFATQTIKRIMQEFTLATRIGAYSFIFTLFCFYLNGRLARRKKHIEGKEIVSSRFLALKLFLKGQASPIRIGPLPFVKGTETHHTLISGASGTGKTNAFHALLPQIRKARQRAIIVDVTGEYVEAYYREGKDILLNPFDNRGVPWHPWCECTEEIHFKNLARSFIAPSYREEEIFWRKGAQEIFFEALKATAFNAKTSSLVKLLLHDSLATLGKVLKGTKAAAHLDLSSEKTAGSFRSFTSTFLDCLELLPDTEDPFSIRQWVLENKSDSWLFLACTPVQRASLTPLLSAWAAIGITALKELPPDVNRRLWYVIDELPKLNRLECLNDFLTESRKFGGCGLLAIQSPAQLEAIYGREMTSTFLGNCATRVAFAEYDAIISKRISESFGQKEIKESQEALSYGAHEMRDGVNLSYQTKNSSVVSPSALQALGNLEAFIKLPGNLPVSKLKLSFQKTKRLSKAFIPISD